MRYRRGAKIDTSQVTDRRRATGAVKKAKRELGITSDPYGQEEGGPKGRPAPKDRNKRTEDQDFDDLLDQWKKMMRRYMRLRRQQMAKAAVASKAAASRGKGAERRKPGTKPKKKGARNPFMESVDRQLAAAPKVGKRNRAQTKATHKARETARKVTRRTRAATRKAAPNPQLAKVQKKVVHKMVKPPKATTRRNMRDR